MSASAEADNLDSEYWYTVFRLLFPIIKREFEGTELRVLNALYYQSEPPSVFVDALAYCINQHSMTDELLRHAKQEIAKSNQTTLLRQDTLVVLLLRDIIGSSVSNWNNKCIEPYVSRLSESKVKLLTSSDHNQKWIRNNCYLCKVILDAVLQSRLPKEAANLLHDIAQSVCTELSMKRKDAGMAVISNLLVLRTFSPAIAARINNVKHPLTGVQKMVLCVFLGNEPTNMPPLMLQQIVEYQKKIKGWAYTMMWQNPVETLRIDELLSNALPPYMPENPDVIDARCVTKWLGSIGLGHYSKMFTVNLIQGPTLFLLDLDDLLELQMNTECRAIFMQGTNQLCKLYQMDLVYTKADLTRSSVFE